MDVIKIIAAIVFLIVLWILLCHLDAQAYNKGYEDRAKDIQHDMDKHIQDKSEAWFNALQVTLTPTYKGVYNANHKRGYCVPKDN